MILAKTALRAAVCLGLLLLQAGVGRWLAGLDVLDELVTGDRLGVGVALALLVPLRALTWFVAPAWLVSGTLCDLWELRARRSPQFQKSG
jgi:hypothetical protein